MKRRIVTAIISVVGAILLFVMTSYAWFSINNDVNVDNIVSDIGSMDLDYSLIRIVDGNVSDTIDTSNEFLNQFVIPGETFEYALVIEKSGSIGETLSVIFRNVTSKENINDSWVTLEANRIDKIQYAFNYQLLGYSYLSEINNVNIENAYDLLGEPSSKIYFNQNTDNYYIIDNVSLNSTNSKIVVFLRLTYESDAVLPNGMTGTVNSNDYVNQMIDINSIIIQSK